VHIDFLGGAQSVTGSCHLVTVNDKKILLDCGLYQGKRNDAFLRNRNLPFQVDSVDAMVLSHAHIDHSGNIPNLVKSGYNRMIYCTHATRDLCSVMLQDAGHIQEKDAEYVNEKNKKKGLPAIEPLYTIQDALTSLEQFISVSYHHPIKIFEDVTVTFFDAGHILGSAVTLMEIRENGRDLRLVFSGDLGRPNMPILRDPDPLFEADILLTESTYGGRYHDNYDTMYDKLARVINDTYHRRGKTIVPAFSVGRTQELVYALNHLSREGKIPSLPIYVDSPLSVNVTEIFRLHPECFDQETRLLLEDNHDPFGFGRLQYIKNVEQSKKLNQITEPCVIISASGMCEAGRILHHLANNIEDAKNTILIVGFMAENTLGRRLVEKEPLVRIFGDTYQVRAQIVKINAFSAHADHNELLSYISRFDHERLKNIFVLHGEAAQSQALAEGLGSLGFSNIRIPASGERVELLS
jgi:metallo-beta-lactamase family protein